MNGIGLAHMNIIIIIDCFDYLQGGETSVHRKAKCRDSEIDVLTGRRGMLLAGCSGLYSVVARSRL